MTIGVVTEDGRIGEALCPSLWAQVPKQAP